MPPGAPMSFLRKPPPPPPVPSGRAFHDRLTRIRPLAPPPLLSDTDGAALVRVTLLSETGLPPLAAGVAGRLV